MKKKLATFKDIDNCLSLIDDGRKQMQESGFTQWTASYPNQKIIEEDIKKQRLWLYGYPTKACLTKRQENESLYIERFVVASNFKGEKLGQRILKTIIAEEKEIKKVQKIIIITNEKNKNMIHLLENTNFYVTHIFKKTERGSKDLFIKYELMI